MLAGPISADVLWRWQHQPIDLAGIGVEVFAATLYTAGAIRVRAAGRHWPAARTACFLAGLIAAALVLQSGFAAYDDTLFWVHVTQHLVLMMLVPPLIALGAPVRLSLAAATPPWRQGIARLLHGRLLRPMIGRSAAMCLVEYYGSMAVYMLTPLYRMSQLYESVHLAVHIYFLTCGLAFWIPMLGMDPVAWRPSYRLRCWLAGIGAPIYLSLGGAVYAEHAFISPTYSPTDLRTGAEVIASVGVPLAFAGLGLIVHTEQRTRRHRAKRQGRPRTRTKSPDREQRGGPPARVASESRLH